MAALGHPAGGGLSGRPRLLLFLVDARDPHRLAIAPALAALAGRAGWDFDLYCDGLRLGRHFGGGDPALAPPGASAGSLVAGGGHVERLLWLVAAYDVAALGHAGSVLWPALGAGGAAVLARTDDPAELQAAAFERLGEPVPALVRVLDAAPQGPLGLELAPYACVELLDGPPAVGVDACADDGLRGRLEALGAHRMCGFGVDGARAAAFPGGLEAADGPVTAGDTYATVTTRWAQRHQAWGRGVLLGDPDLVAAGLPRARRLRLLALHGRPQVDVLRSAHDIVRSAREPVYGRQYDDRDFLVLAELGHGLQVIDPAPPFDSAHRVPPPVPSPPCALADLEPDDGQLERWADEGRVLCTALLWSGMVREADGLPRLIDLVAQTGLRAGLVLTVDTITHGAGSALELLAVPPERGGVLGLLEPLVGSTGRGVAIESRLPDGALHTHLADAVPALAALLPEGLRPRGWWPLLDTALVSRRSRPVGLREGRPVVRFTPRGAGAAPAVGAHVPTAGAPPPRARLDARGLAGRAVRATRLDSVLEERRPFDEMRPGALDERVVTAVRDCGLSYLWTKASFGIPRATVRDGVVALPFTAGGWDGWSPFYTLRSRSDVTRAESRLRRSGQPGWLASTVDSPLWAMSGEVWREGSRLYEIAELLADGGRSGELVNVAPNVIARYARIISAREGDAG